jgi:protein-tyrosine phosphatase
MRAASVYWVNKIEPWKIALAARPRGGEDLDDEMLAWRAAGVDLVVSLLETSEVRELDLAQQEVSCRRNNIAFMRFAISDRGIPEYRREFKLLIESLSKEVLSGKSLAIHCRAGIGRTGLVACCLLQSLGMKSEPAFRLLSEARGVPVPDTTEQQEYAGKFLL